MAKRMYAGVNGTGKKIKKGYVGVDGICRKIKKAYIGVGGIARQVFTGGTLVYFGKITQMEKAIYNMSAQSVDGYAFFVGGSILSSNGLTTTNKAYAFDHALVRHDASNLSSSKGNMGTARLENKAFFCNGAYKAADYSGYTDVYDANLTYQSVWMLVQRGAPGTAATEGHVVVAGGNGTGGNGKTAFVEAISKELTRTTLDDLPNKVSNVGGVAAGGKALICGGRTGSDSNSYTNVVTAYDDNLVKSSAPALAVAGCEFATAEVGNFGLVAGGACVNSGYLSTVNVYDKNLVRTIAAPLSVARRGFQGTTVDAFAVFGGGWSSQTMYSNVDVYDESLVKTTATPLSEAKFGVAAASVGDNVLFIGGYNQKSEINPDVEVYILK